MHQIDHDLLSYLEPHELGRLQSLLAQHRQWWRPEHSNKPQCMAFASTADVIGYGGAAGCGKTDLICGKALKQHQRVLIVRREKDQTQGIVQRLQEILGSPDGYNSQRSRWQVPVANRPLIEFGGLDHPGDESRWQGRPHDLLALDEAAEMREHQVRFLMGWNRTADPNQRCTTLMTFNPPQDAEGRWIIAFFGPWLDKKHPRYPAKPGELLWFARSLDGKRDILLKDNRPFVFDEDGEPVYRFDPKKYGPSKIVQPQSRTFFPARVTDNRYYVESGYMAKLHQLPEPLRSQMRDGDFQAGIEDDAYQIIPTRWVEIAMAKWKRPDRLQPMDSLGVDVAMGGKDNTVLQARHGMWFDEPILHTGKESLDGPTIAGWCVAALRDEAVIHIDLLGVGAEPYGHLMKMRLQVVGVNFGGVTAETSESGHLEFFNERSKRWWRMREALDPAANTGIALPPNQQLLADLTAIKWRPKSGRIQAESRDEIVARIGRSLDHGTAAILALIDTPKQREVEALQRRGSPRRYDPLEEMDRENGGGRGGGYDPLDRM